jgi:hypothetical protein
MYMYAPCVLCPVSCVHSVCGLVSWCVVLAVMLIYMKSFLLLATLCLVVASRVGVCAAGALRAARRGAAGGGALLLLPSSSARTPYAANL